MSFPGTDSLAAFNALPDDTFHWTPELRKQLPPAIQREQRERYPVPPLDMTWAPSPFSEWTSEALRELNPACRSAIAASGVLTASAVQQLPQDLPAWQRMVVGLLDTEDPEAAKNYFSSNARHEKAKKHDRLLEWLLRSAWHGVGPADTMKLLRELVETPTTTRVGRVAWADFVHAERLKAAWHWLAALDDTAHASVQDAVQWLQHTVFTGNDYWFGWLYMMRARTASERVSADIALVVGEDSEASALFLIEHAGAEAFDGLKLRLGRLVSAFSGWGSAPSTFRKDTHGKVKKIMKLWMGYHHERLIDCVLEYPGDPLMLTYLAELVARWPRLVLTRALALKKGYNSSLSSLIINALVPHPDWVTPLREALEELDPGVKPDALRRLQAVVNGLPTEPVSPAATTASDAPTAATKQSADLTTDQPSDPPSDLPELLRNPPWTWAKKPTPQQKADQPWLKLPSRMPPMPPFLAPSRLTPPLLKASGQLLGLGALNALLTMFLISKPGAPYPGLAQVLPALESRSLAHLGMQLQQEWEQAGAPTDERWMLLAQAWTADDQNMERLVRDIALWPSLMAFPRAKFGLSVLADMAAFQGNDEPLKALIRFAEKGKSSLRKPAQQQVQNAAAAMGLTPEQLADRLIPDLGLAKPERSIFDFGKRRFALHFDDALQVYLSDENGKRLKDIPKPNADDNSRWAENETKRWKTLKKAARTLATEQLDRLERALISQRLWSASEFSRLFQKHPLLREMGRRLLWCTDDTTPRHFRLTEDFRTVDLQDDPVVLNEPLSVRLAHPMHLDANELAAWVQQWADYELLQPFEQFARRVYRLEPDTPEVRADVPSVRNQAVAAGSLLGLIQQGWTKLQDGAHIYGLRWEVPGGGSATLMLHDGLDASSPLAVPVLRISSLTLEPTLGPLACSEVLRTVDRLARA